MIVNKKNGKDVIVKPIVLHQLFSNSIRTEVPHAQLLLVIAPARVSVFVHAYHFYIWPQVRVYELKTD